MRCQIWRFKKNRPFWLVFGRLRFDSWLMPQLWRLITLQPYQPKGHIVPHKKFLKSLFNRVGAQDHVSYFIKVMSFSSKYSKFQDTYLIRICILFVMANKIHKEQMTRNQAWSQVGDALLIETEMKYENWLEIKWPKPDFSI